MLYGKYQFLCRLENEAILPFYKGSTFRGLFGHALKKIVCALKRQECDQCLLKGRCVYALVFEIQVAMQLPKDSRIASPPHPFVIEPPQTTETNFPKGSSFDFNLLLFGEVNHNLPYFIYSVDLLKAPKDPGTLMLSLVREETARLTLNLIAGKIIYKKIELDMMPARLALYAFFAMQKKDCPLETESCGNCTDCFIDIQTVFEKQKQITGLYRKVCGTRPVNEMSDSGITALSADNFNSYKSRIKENFQKKFGPYAVKKLEITSVGTRPNTRYGIMMNKSKIEIVY